MAARRQERFSVVLAAVDKVSAPIRRINRRIESMVAPVRKVARAFKSLVREAGFGKLAAGVKRLGASFARLGLGAAAALGGLFIALKRTAEGLDNIGKITSRLNFPVEQFQAWKIEAMLAGQSGEAFDKSIEKLSKNLGDMKLRTGELFTTLQKLNPALGAQLDTVNDSEEAFKLVLNAIRKTEDVTLRSALANAAFGRSGKDLINLSMKSAAELDNLVARHIKLGNVVSARSIKAAEKFNDSMLVMQRAVGAVWSEIAGFLFPVLTKLIDLTTVWVQKNREVVIKGVIEFLKDTKAALVPVVKFLKEAIPPTIELVKRFGGMKLVLGVLAAVVLLPLAAAVAAVGAALFSTAGLVVGAAAAIAGLVAVIVANWELLPTIIFNVLLSINRAASGLFDGLKAIVLGTVDSIVAAFKSLIDIIPQPILDFLKGGSAFSLLGAGVSAVASLVAPASGGAGLATPEAPGMAKSELVVRIEEGRVKSAEIVSGSDVVLAEGGLVGSAF